MLEDTEETCQTCQEVDIHVLNGEWLDDALGVACAASLRAMVGRGAVGEIRLPLVLAP